MLAYLQASAQILPPPRELLFATPPPCECVGKNSGIAPDFTADYGTKCSPWDMLTPGCNPGGKYYYESGPAPWCEGNWCYVSASCSTAHKSRFFAETEDLFYAYPPCGNADPFTSVADKDFNRDGLICLPEQQAYAQRMAEAMFKDGNEITLQQLLAQRLVQAGVLNEELAKSTREGFEKLDVDEDGLLEKEEFWDGKLKAFLSSLPGQCATHAEYFKFLSPNYLDEDGDNA